MSLSVAGDVIRHQSSESSNQASRLLWKEDLEKLGWKVEDLVHEIAIEQTDTLNQSHLVALLIVSRFPLSDAHINAFVSWLQCQ